tara:strand:- start:366 stop:1061 length:696 start_codon:yes stop_codon:yes gene_type:complete
MDNQKNQLLEFVNHDEECKKQLKSFDDSIMLDIWKKSLEQNKPAYYLYNDNFFLVASYVCWKKYSKKYINLLYKNEVCKELLNDCNDIVDVGNGLGYSTQLLSELFTSNVSCIQLPDTEQYKYNVMLGNKITTLDDIDTADCFIAFDFMEHIYEPIEYLDTILTKKPKLIILANSFGTDAVGHFREYKVGDDIVNEKKISRIFNKHLRNNKFELLKLKFWNNRPCVWKLIV